MKMNKIEAMAEALICCWIDDRKMADVGRMFSRLIESQEPRSDVVLNKYVTFTQPCRAFMRANFSTINDMLWDGANSDRVRSKLRVALGEKKAGTRGIKVSVRERDKRRDWGVVK